MRLIFANLIGFWLFYFALSQDEVHSNFTAKEFSILAAVKSEESVWNKACVGCRQTNIPVAFLSELYHSDIPKRIHPIHHMWKVFLHEKNQKNSSEDGLVLPIQFGSWILRDLTNLARPAKSIHFNELLPPNIDGREAIGNSQDREDQWLYYSWFYGMVDGVILESGALDGIKYSNSLYFEKEANWTAIHIEAGKENFRRLTINRPDAVNFNTALCSNISALHYASSPHNTEVEGIFEFMDKEFKDKWYPDHIKNPQLVNNFPLLSCLPLKYILSSFNLKHIDIWVLDVEGAEEEVLAGMDWKLVSISVIMMECDGSDDGKDARKRATLASVGFECLQVYRNCMCRHKDFKPSTIIREGQAISSPKTRITIYTLKDGVLRAFPNFDTYQQFLQNGGKASIQVDDTIFGLYPIGDDLPPCTNC